MTVMVQRALAVYQSSVESKPKEQKVEQSPIDMRLEGPATYLTEEESRIRLHARAAGLSGVKSTLAVSNSGHIGNTGFRGEPRWWYRCGEIGHLKQTCHKSPKKRDAGERRQSGGRGYGRGGKRGERGDYRANLMVAEGESEEVLKRKQNAAGNGKSVAEDASTSSSHRGNFACFAQSTIGVCDTLSLASIPTTRSPDWIVDSGATHHVTGAAGEFSTYTHLVVPYSIQTADGTAQPMVSKGTVRCIDLVTLINVLHAPSFPVNMVSISDIIHKQKWIVTFDIPRMVFQENGAGQILGTGIWRDELWYVDRKEMDTVLPSVVDRVGAGGYGVSVDDELLLIHRRMGHSSFSLLEYLYPSKYKKADKEKLVSDGCEFGKHTRSSYVSSRSRSSHAFDLVLSDV